MGGDVNYQGHFNYSIDLMTVPGRNGLSFPLNLNYESGRRVDEDASWVGWGWDLSTGYITRAVVNYPDEFPGEGFFAEGQETVIIEDMTFPDREFVFDCADKFYLVLPGGGGGEMVIAEPIDQGGGLLGDMGIPIELQDQTLEFKCYQWNSWKTLAHIAGGSGNVPQHFDWFEVTTDDGTKYRFDQVCWSNTEELHYIATTGEPDKKKLILEYLWDRPTETYWGSYGDSVNYQYGRKAPYFWGLTQILSPDYVDVSPAGPDDNDFGSWVKLTYDYPVNTGYSDGFFDISDDALMYETRYEWMGTDIINYRAGMNEANTESGETEYDKSIQDNLYIGDDISSTLPVELTDTSYNFDTGENDSSIQKNVNEDIRTRREDVRENFESVLDPISIISSTVPGLSSILEDDLVDNIANVSQEKTWFIENDQADNKGQMEPGDIYYHKFRKVRTWLTFAVVDTIETPTHKAYLNTSERTGADCVARIDDSSLGTNHTYHLDDIILKSKIGGSESVVSRAELTFRDDEDGLCYDDNPVVDPPLSNKTGGKLTLDSVQIFGQLDGLPKYYFKYGDEDNFSDTNPDILYAKSNIGAMGYFLDGSFDRDAFVYNLTDIFLPTGGKIEVEYEDNEIEYWQNNPITGNARNYGGGRVSEIRSYTGMVYDSGGGRNITDFEYEKGVVLTNPATIVKKYSPAGVTYRGNYVAYNKITKVVYIANFLRKYSGTLPIGTDYNTSIKYYTNYTTALNYPDAEILGPEGNTYWVYSNEWKRGLVMFQGEESGNRVVYEYDLNSTQYPTASTGLFLGYNPHYYKHIFDGEVFKFIYAPGWAKLLSKTTRIDGVELKQSYDYRYKEPDYSEDTGDDGEFEAGDDRGYRKANGLPNTIRYLKPASGSALLSYRNKASNAKERFISIGKELVSSMFNRVKNDGEIAGESPSRIFGNYLSGLKEEVINSLKSEEEIYHKHITYAYDIADPLHRDYGNPAYWTMFNENTDDHKNMMSAKHRIITEDSNNQGMTYNQIDYFRRLVNGEYQIYPDESKQWLLYNGQGRYIHSYFDEYDNWGNLTRVTDPLGRETSAVYDYAKHSLPTSITNAADFTTQIEYDDTLLAITKITDPNGLETDYEYDSYGRLTDIYYPNNPKATAPYSSVQYTYEWQNRTPGNFFDHNNEASDFCRIGTRTLVSAGTGNFRRSWQYFNGLGENFRTTVQSDSVADKWIYSDTTFFATGTVNMSNIPYEADSWSNALPLPLPYYIHITGDGRYIPFSENMLEIAECTLSQYKEGAEYLLNSNVFATFYPNYEGDCDRVKFEIDWEGTYELIPESTIFNGFSAISEHGGVTDENYRYVKTIDGEGRTVNDYFDERGNLVRRNEGKLTENFRWEYDECDYCNPACYIPTGVTWDDDISPGLSTTDTYYFYDELSRLTNVLDARDFVHTFTYDSLGRLRTAEDPDRGLTSYGYDDVGNLTMFADAELSANNSQISYYYDALNRLRSEQVTLNAFTFSGDDENQTDFSADLSIFGSEMGLYNSNKLNIGGGGFNMIPPDTGPDGHFKLFSFTEETKSEYFYDTYDSPTDNNTQSEGYPETVDTIGSDATKGKLVRVEDKIGEKTLYYDDMGRVIQIDEDRKYFDNSEYTHKYEYNTIGDLTEETYPSGLSIEYKYDSMGRLKYIPGFFGEEPEPFESLNDRGELMNALGSERTFNRKNAGIAARMFPSLLARNATREASPELQKELAYHGVSLNLGQAFDGFEYDDFGRLYQINANNAVNTNFSFDERQLVTRLSLNFIEDPVRYSFAYDNSLQVNEITDNLFVNTINDDEFWRTREFTYDNFNRLKQYEETWTPASSVEPISTSGGISGVAASAGAGGGFGLINGGSEPGNSVPIRDITYNYDQLGNRLRYKDNLTLETFPYTYSDDNNRMLTDPDENGYLYDNRGAIVWKGDSSIVPGEDTEYTNYEYDYAGRLVRIENHETEGSSGGKGKDDSDKDNKFGSPNDKESNKRSSGDNRTGKGTGSEMAGLSGDAVALGANKGKNSPSNDSIGKDKQPAGGEQLDGVGETFEAWGFTYDGGGARIYKEGPTTSSKYIYDATGRLITEFSNDFTKSSGNVIKNAGFEVSSDDMGTTGGNGEEDEKSDPEIGDENRVDAALNENELSDENSLEGEEKDGTKSTLNPIFAEWNDVVTGDQGEIGSYNFGDDETGPEGETAAYLERTRDSGDLYLYQALELTAGRTYEVRFWARQDDLINGAYVELRDPTTVFPGDDGMVLRSVPILAEEWTEYSIPFVVGDGFENLHLALEIEAGGGNTGTAFFDRVTVCEYLNDTANPSFEVSAHVISGTDFADWEEIVAPGGGEAIGTADGLVSDNSAILTRAGGADGPYLQQNVLMFGETHEISFYAKASASFMGAPPEVVCDIIWDEEGGNPTTYPLDLTSEELDDDWFRYSGYYTSQVSDMVTPPANPVRAVRIGAAGEEGSVILEDVTVKPVSDVVDGGDMEVYVEIAAFPGSPLKADFVGWEENMPDQYGYMLAETTDVFMNEASTKVVHTNVVMSPATPPVTMTQQIPCLPGTEYEIVVAYKVDGGGGPGSFEKPLDAFYGAMCLVGEGIAPSSIIEPDEYWEYDGEYIEVVNSDGTEDGEWVVARSTYRTTGDTLDVLIGMGQGTTGECNFDAVMIRDLTTRRYEYVYGKGRKLAKVEYEGDVMEAQVYYYHNDLLGSPVAMTDMDGKTVWKGDYMPFGEDISPQTSWGNDYTYLGNEDDGGLMYFNARYYQKEVGRFTSCDPIKSVDSTLSMNPYVYCANNPISYTDPTGLDRMRPQPPPGEDGGGNPHQTAEFTAWMESVVEGFEFTADGDTSTDMGIPDNSSGKTQETVTLYLLIDLRELSADSKTISALKNAIEFGHGEGSVNAYNATMNVDGGVDAIIDNVLDILRKNDGALNIFVEAHGDGLIGSHIGGSGFSIEDALAWVSANMDLVGYIKSAVGQERLSNVNIRLMSCGGPLGGVPFLLKNSGGNYTLLTSPASPINRANFDKRVASGVFPSGFFAKVYEWDFDAKMPDNPKNPFDVHGSRIISPLMPGVQQLFKAINVNFDDYYDYYKGK